MTDRFLTRIIYVSGIALAVFLVLLGWLSIRVHKAAKTGMEKTVWVEGNLVHALYLDMTLSGFARTGVMRSELGWESRYEAVEPKLQEILNDIFSVLPESEKQSLAIQTEAASQSLRMKEKQAFPLLRQGKRQQAYDLLFSESYDQQRDRYYQVLGTLGEALKKYEASLIQKGQKELYRSILVLVIAFPVLFLSGLTFYRLLNRWQSELRKLNSRLEEMAVTDELTKLYNRRFFYQEIIKPIERSKRYQEPFSILMMDLDYFKKVNDTYGHHAGDLVLKSVAQSLKLNLRLTDFACRFGGEEFIIVLSNTNSSEAKIFAERVRQDVASRPVQTEEGQSIPVTLSIGMSQYEPEEPLESLIGRADAALYEAKENGRNRCILH